MIIPAHGARISLRQLRYFIAIADARTYSQAAKNLFVSQPTLTVAMQKLSKDLNATLFTQTSNGYELTESGSLLYQEGARILQEVNELETKIREIENRGVVNIRVGFTHLFCLQFMEKILAFISRYPNVELTLVQNGSRELQRQVSEGELELAVVSFPQYYPELEIEPMKSIKVYDIGIVVTPKNPLSECSSVRWEDLRDHSFSSLGRDYVIFHLLHEQAQKAGYHPKIAFTNNNEEILINSVEQLDSVCVMPLAMQASYPNHDLRWIPIKDQGATIPIGIAVQANAKLSQGVSEFKEMLQGNA